MALRSKSLFLFNFQVTATNCYMTFKDGASSTRVATLNLGYYSLSSLLDELVRAMTAADPTHTYTATANRTIAGGLQNRVTIATTNTYLQLLFSTGNPSNPASLLGFNTADYTGAITYSGSSSAGTVLVPTEIGYSYQPPTTLKKNFGVLNVSASGIKESVTFSLQEFIKVQFKYIPEADLAADWEGLIEWMIQQREFEFTPQISAPSTFYAVTLEEPGLTMELAEMLPSFPFQYQTPMLKFRVST